MGRDECCRSCRRQRRLVDRAQAALLMAVDTARLAGHATVTLDEHRTPTSRAAAGAAHARAQTAAGVAWDALEQLRTHGPSQDLAQVDATPNAARNVALAAATR